MENLFIIDDLGVPLSQETTIAFQILLAAFSLQKGIAEGFDFTFRVGRRPH